MGDVAVTFSSQSESVHRQFQCCLSTWLKIANALITMYQSHVVSLHLSSLELMYRDLF